MKAEGQNDSTVLSSDHAHIPTSYAHSNNKFKIFLKEILGGDFIPKKNCISAELMLSFLKGTNVFGYFCV